MSDPPRNVHIVDCRNETEKAGERVLDIHGVDFNGFLQLISKEFSIPSGETFLLTTTDKTEIDSHQYGELEGGTLHLWNTPPLAQECIHFAPHYNTLVEGGMYEYYASAGQNSLPYAFAELIDNSLSATSCVTGPRTIEIRLLFDESQGKPGVVVLDNGCGMTSKQLNNWAVYRLSKFTRDNSRFPSDNADYVRPEPVPRSLNSDISFFGVGGKQAAFYIGHSTRMITKPVGSPDVHELVISKEDFERKARNKEEIYSGFIQNRKAGDSTHIKDEEERFLHGLIAEEVGKDSFTALVLTGVHPEHITLLRKEFHMWTRELAHLYHYYIHGIHGNDMKSNRKKISNIDIQITLQEKSHKTPRRVNLRDIVDDMQSLYINAATDTFEFKAYTQHEGMVEGILRYHPFLYDRETYPEDHNATIAPVDEDDEDCVALEPARMKRPIFECFWNGRLIPYTRVSEFNWCSRQRGKKAAQLPDECYSRFSGVLFTNDRFRVSQNKLTFMDLEMQLQDNSTFFTRILQGQEQRGKIEKDFNQWLKNCNEKWDKQVEFIGFKETIKRMDVPTKKMQYPWATFSSIKWDGKTYKTGQYLKSQKTHPIFYGSVQQFLLFGDHDGDIYATGGQVQLTMEPKELYNEVKIIPISKIDRSVKMSSIKKGIDEERAAKLPDKLNVMWPESNPWSQNDERPAGTFLGPLQVEILNKKGESISRMPSTSHSAIKKLMIELKVVWHGPNGDVETNSHIAQHAAKWSFWFKTMENLNKLGKYTLSLNTVLNESNATDFAGMQLPSHQLDFSIKEGSAESFAVGTLTTPLHVGASFDIPLEMVDAYGYPAQAPSDLKPVLECSDLEVSYEGTKASGTTFTIKRVKVEGKLRVLNSQSKTYDMKVFLPGLNQHTQTFKISPLPGKPHSLRIQPEDQPIKVENGKSVSFNVEILDISGNVTAHPKLIVRCQIHGVMMAIDCSSTGAGLLVSKALFVKNITGDKLIKAKFDVPSQKSMATVERVLMVTPSKRVSRLQVYSRDVDGDSIELKDKEKVDWAAGDVLENLYFRLYDEGNREVPLSATLAPKIKVNWTADMNLEDLAQGKLPNIQVPTLVQDEHFYQVSYQDENLSVDTSFTIVPHADEPKHMKATVANTSVRLGEVLTESIYLHLTDQYGNKTKTLTSTCVDSLSADCEGLDKSALVFTWQVTSHSILVQGVRFNPGIPVPGSREITFTWKDFLAHVRVKVMPGLPAKLKLLDGPEEPLQVLNEQGIAKRFVVQLCDEWGNPSTDQRVVVSLKGNSASLKMRLSVLSQPVDAKGKASFTVNSVCGPKGEYELEFSSSFNQRPIPGPILKLVIIPDPLKPVRLDVQYDTMAECLAGAALTVFTVSVISEEGGPIMNLNPAAVSMYMWKDVTSKTKYPPKNAEDFKCSKPMADERDDCLYFRDKIIPEKAGTYIIQFALTGIKTLWGKQYFISVVANEPCKLSPDILPPTPVVSNNVQVSSRTLVEAMTMRLLDEYNNHAGLELQGKVVVTMRSLDGRKLPLFYDRLRTLTFSLSNGKVDIPSLSIMENSPGENGQEYILHFNPVITGFDRKKLLSAFQLPFRFYNDVENQEQMAKLTKEKDRLSHTILQYKSWSETNKELLEQLTYAKNEASSKENQLNAVLRRKSLNVAQLTTMPAIEAAIRKNLAEAEQIRQQPRRKCSVQDPFIGSVDVLGKVANLALVADDDAAWVLSFHLRGDMDMVITTTTAAAMKIYHDTNGRQQVMPLETVFWKNSNRPLPHIKNGRSSFSPIGNPVFARDLLIYPHKAESCQTAFGNILGDTILIDDLDSANHYRKGVIQSQVRCPTLLTRRGERVLSNGKFGGGQNMAPPVEQMRGLMFGSPMPPLYQSLMEQIDVLKLKRSAKEKTMKSQSDLDKHIFEMKSPEAMAKEEDLEQHQRNLVEIEKTLASSTQRAAKRGHEEAGEPSTPSTAFLKKSRRK